MSSQRRVSRALAMSASASPARILALVILNLAFAVLKIGARSEDAVERWLAVETPPPLRRLRRHAGTFHDPANHGIFVRVPLAADRGDAECDGFVVGHVCLCL
jgi:hypothetical protein